jgi:hypothetical protein
MGNPVSIDRINYQTTPYPPTIYGAAIEPDYNDSFAVGENHGFNYEIDTSASSFNVDAYGITSTCSGIEGLPGRTTGSTPNAVYFEPFALTIPPSLAETQCTLARLAAITFPNEPVHLLETFYTAKVEKRKGSQVEIFTNVEGFTDDNKNFDPTRDMLLTGVGFSRSPEGKVEFTGFSSPDCTIEGLPGAQTGHYDLHFPASHLVIKDWRDGSTSCQLNATYNMEGETFPVSINIPLPKKEKPVLPEKEHRVFAPFITSGRAKNISQPYIDGSLKHPPGDRRRRKIYR